MNERPILFSTDMARAILDGRKTQTRRVINPQPTIDKDGMWRWKDCQWMDGGLGFPQSGVDDYAPYKPGDILWVRETWLMADDGYHYKADATPESEELRKKYGYKWRSPRFMPREAARLFLEVKNVRVEKLQNISEKDAEAAGVIVPPLPTIADPALKRRMAFSALWDELNEKRGYPWESNPWVWVYEFMRREQ